MKATSQEVRQPVNEIEQGKGPSEQNRSVYKCLIQEIYWGMAKERVEKNCVSRNVGQNLNAIAYVEAEKHRTVFWL